MFNAKKQRIAELQARVTQLVEERDAALAEAALHLSASVRTAGRNTHLSEQLEGAQYSLYHAEQRISLLARVCGLRRRRATGDARLIRSQQQRLDDLLGFNDQTILDGARWQERRTDKPREVKP